MDVFCSFSFKLILVGHRFCKDVETNKHVKPFHRNHTTVTIVYHSKFLPLEIHQYTIRIDDKITTTTVRAWMTFDKSDVQIDIDFAIQKQKISLLKDN